MIRKQKMKFKTLVFSGLFLLAACSSSPEKNSSDSDIYFAIAKEYLVESNIDNGLKQIENAIDAYPLNFAAHFLKLETLAQAGRFYEAFQAAKTGGALLPPEERYQIDHWLGVIHYHNSDLEKAVAKLESSASSKPDFADNYNLLGQLYTKKGKLDKAIESYLRWTELEPESDHAWSQLGMTYATNKKFGKAKTALDKAISINSDNAAAYNYLGSWAMEQERWADTEKYLLKSLKLNDANQYANLNYAQFLMLRDRHREALPYLDKSYELDSGIVFTLFWFGKYHYKEKDYEKAYEYFSNAIKQDPAFWPARMEISNMYLELGRSYDKALSVMKNGLQTDPRNQKGYYYHLTKLTLADNKPVTALDYSEKARKLVKDSEVTERSELHLLRGKIFEKLGKPDKARSEYKTVMAINPGSPFAQEAVKHISN